MSGFELTCFSSPADGISSGSVIVQVGEDKGPKYLFNAPEGFARLVLEHKVRPSQHLRAAFLTQLQPHAAGGLAGLIMRLCQDGHEELQVHGPIGLAANLHGLRHFVRWKHPRVFASEHSQWEPPQVYEDGHVHVAALQQGGLAWPCPAWLRPPDNQHEAAPPGNSALITPNKSSAAVNALGREQAVNYISTDDVISQDDASDTSSSTSDDAGVDSVAKIVHEQITAPVSLAQMPSSLNKAISSGTSEESSNSSDGHDASNSNSSSSGSDASSSSSDTEQGPVGQQAAFRQLDSLFASSAASGAVSTHLAALDLLKRVPAVKARPGSSTGMSGLTAGRLSAAQSGVKLRKQGHEPQQQQQNQQQEREQQQQQQQQRLSRANKGSKPRAETRAVQGKGSSRNGAGLADAKGGKEPHKAEWVQMQDGGNPLYLQQKHGLPGEVSRGKTDMGIWGYLVHFKATGMLLLLVDNPSVHAVSAIAKHPVCHYMQQQPSRCAGVVHLSSPEISSKGAYIRWSKSLPGQQVMLNGGKLHIFQSAMRATARLHLLSPAVFPLPFGAKVPPSQAPTTAVSKKVTEAASEAAATTAVEALPSTEGISSGAGVQQAQQMLSSSNLGAINLPGASPQVKRSIDDLAAKHAQQVTAEGQVDDLTPVPNKQAIKSVMKAVLHKAGSKASNAVLPSVADVAAQRLQALIAGPVTKVVSGNKGLGVADRDTTELKTPSLGEVQQELLNSKPAFARFVEQLKGSHPAFFQQTKPAKAASQQTTILHGAAASAQMSPASFSRQITPSNLQNPDHLPRHQQKKRNGNAVSISHDLLSHAAEPGFSGNHTHGAWPEQRSFHAQHQGMGLPGTIMHPQGHSVGPFPNAPQMPAPPPGFALVPIASDGSLHYPGAIVSPNAVGGNMWQPQSFGYSAPSEHSQATQQQLYHHSSQSCSDSQSGLLHSQRLPQQHQLPAPAAEQGCRQHHWHLLQQQQQQQQQQQSAGLNHRKRKTSDNQDVGINGSCGNVPDSNAGAAAQLRQKLKTALPSSSSQSKPQLLSGLPQLGPTQALSQQANDVRTTPVSKESKPGLLRDSIDLPSSERQNVADSAVAKSEHRRVRSSSSHEAEQDVYRGPHGPDCVRCVDRTQLNFLGTGSAEPSKYRGASAIHIRLDSGWGVLLDAGEGSWGSLVRMYGHKAAFDQVNSLALVWISHKHADHMLGLPAILAARHTTCPPLQVVGPSEAAKWLSDISTAQQLRYSFLHCSQLNRMSQQQQFEMLNHTGLESLRAVPVNHCYDAYGLVMLHTDSWKLVYSGDTRPCRALQEAGRECTLLIHEATFEPELVDHAKAKKHSTTEEALHVAATMCAYRTVLTHFSQRYSKVPVALQKGHRAKSAVIAFDGMSIPLTLLPDLPQLAEGVALAFAEEESVADTVAVSNE